MPTKPARRSLLDHDRRIWVLWFGMALNQFGMSIVMPFVSVYLYSYQGIPAGRVGLALFISILVGAVFQLIGGELCDRLGRKSVFVAGLGLLIATFLLLGWAVSHHARYGWYLFLLSLSRVATGLFRPIPTIIATDIVAPEERLRVFGLLRIAQNLGFAIGPLVGGAMARISYASTFRLTAATSTVYLLLVVLFIRDTSSARPTERFRLSDLAELRRERPFIVFVLLAFLISVVYSTMYSPLAVYAKGFAQLDESAIGLLYTINGGMVVLLQYPITVLADRHRLTTGLAAGAALYGAGLLLVGHSHDLVHLGLCVSVVTLGELFQSPSATALVTSLADQSHYGRYFGVQGLMSSLGFAVGPLLGGTLIDLFKASPAVPWELIGAAGWVSSLGFVYLGRHIPEEKNRPAATSPDGSS